jgi:hypothetical protein
MQNAEDIGRRTAPNVACFQLGLEVSGQRVCFT